MLEKMFTAKNLTLIALITAVLAVFLTLQHGVAKNGCSFSLFSLQLRALSFYLGLH
ncbi:hypothetical protein [Planomicrobium okeanokoites]|uniref:hypothetical protein n=1 Tax=Planomicrobium okeanokoites TaxID=244 RepID=UPI002491D33B|nr:hypothetical protein [Planomicrobium okeanokoites]